MPRELFIVARDRPDLYRYLTQTFADAENVQVVWDRRADERRRDGDAGGASRQHEDRRRRPHVEAELRTVGYAFLSFE
jgi:hypothetical protein